jgi:hypothetical protein
MIMPLSYLGNTRTFLIQACIDAVISDSYFEPTQTTLATPSETVGRPGDITLRRGSATATAESTTEARSELAGGATFLAFLAATVATLTRRTGTTLALLTTQHAARGSVGALLLDVGSRDNLSGEMKPFTEVVETL